MKSFAMAAAVCLVAGCSGNKPDSAFVKADVERFSNRDKGRNAKLAIGDPAQAARLASYFNYGDAFDVAKEPLADSFANSRGNGYTITLYENDGAARRLFIQPDLSNWTAGQGKDWWQVRPGAKEFIEKLFEEKGEPKPADVTP